MGLLDRLFGRRHHDRYGPQQYGQQGYGDEQYGGHGYGDEQYGGHGYGDAAPHRAGGRAGQLSDEQAVARYRYLLRTA